MAGTQKYWIDGLPLGGLDSSGSQKYWIDGLPYIVDPTGAAPPAVATAYGFWCNGPVGLPASITGDIGILS